MKPKSIAVSVVVSAVFACIGMAPATAQHMQHLNTPVIDQAQQQIRARIEQGIASGHITQHEAQMLYQRERELQFREIRMKRDGTATPQERWRLRQDLGDMHAEVDRKLANRQIATRHGSHIPGVDRVQYQIHSRIAHGIRTGHITKREADRLFAKERRLHRHEARFKSDGHVTRAERRQLRDEVAMLNDDVERMMSNRRRY